MFLVVLLLPFVLSSYWVQILTSVGDLQHRGAEPGTADGSRRAGLAGQIALLAVGGWVALRLGFAFDSLPFPVLLLLTGAITA